MNGPDVLRIVDAIHRDKNIDKEIVFDGIEQAIISAARKHFGEEADVQMSIDRESGQVSGAIEGEELDAAEIDSLGRIAAQTAKQVIIQKIREAERDSLYDEYTELRGHIVTGTVSRMEHGSATVNLGKVEAILPRGEQIPGESHRVGERVRAVVLEVKKAGTRVKIILSRTHPELVRRLFELEIPEVAEHVIDVRSLAREAGYRSKVAVSCFDSKIDAVGACVGVRGSRIKSVVDELAGERIDIVRWNDSLQVLVPNALQPAEVDDVILCPMLGKVIVLVQEDNLSLAIGKKGQNVRLASKLVGWDIHVMTQERLDDQLDVAVAAFSQVPGIVEELAENLVAQGFFTFDDLSVIEPDQLAELGGLTAEQCEAIVEYADREAIRQEEQEKLAALRAAHEHVAAAAASAAEPAPAEETEAEGGGEAAAEVASAAAETAEAGESPADEAQASPDETDAPAAEDSDTDETGAEEQETVRAAAEGEPVEGNGQAVSPSEPAETEEPTAGELADEVAEAVAAPSGDGSVTQETRDVSTEAEKATNI